MTTLKQFNSVVNFMTVAGQEVNTEWKNPSTKTAKFRLRLIEEEMNGKSELFDSLDNDNLVGILDGICDVLYVAYGAYATFGLTPVENDIYQHLAEQRSEPVTMSYAFALSRQVRGGYEQLQRGLELGDQRTITVGLNNVVLSTVQLAQEHNFDLAGAFDEVHQSNMSKFCETREQAEADIIFRANSDSPSAKDYIGATVSEVQTAGKSYFMINRASDGKVLKGTGFFEPDLSKFIN